MPKTKEQKKKIVEEVQEKISRYKVLIFADFAGLVVSKMTRLRRELKKEKIDFKVIRKTLLRKAFDHEKIDLNPKTLEGELGLAIGYDDEVSPAKIIHKFSKENPELKILGGVIANRYVSKEEMVNIAKLPSREALLAKTLWLLNYPRSGLVNVLHGNLRNLVYVLSKIKSR